MKFELLDILGKEDSSEEVRNAIKKYKLLDVRKSSGEIRRGSKKVGADLIIEKGQVVAIQIYLRPDSPWEAWKGAPPFGIRQGMNQQEVHATVGKPSESDEFDSRYEMRDKDAKLIVVYDDLIVKFLSIERLG